MRIAEIPFTEYQARVEEGATVILPSGALEQHGPHLPLATDTIIPTRLAELVAPKVGALVAPAFAYGVRSQPKSGGGEHFCGTTSLWGSTFALMLSDVVQAFGRHGVKKLVVLDGHSENQHFLVEGIERALIELRRDGIADMRVIRLGYWTTINERVQSFLFPNGNVNWDLEHAAVMETSVMMHLAPDLVRLDAIPDEPQAVFPPYERFPLDPGPVPPLGALSSAKSATADKGRTVVDSLVADFTTLLPEAFT